MHPFPTLRSSDPPRRFPWRTHRLLLAMGLCMFSFNFYFFYLAAAYLTSGLLAVVFSMTVVLNIVNARLLLGRRAAPRSLVAAALGVAGIAALFWPEIGRDRKSTRLNSSH